MSSDVEIAQNHTLEPIMDIAARAGLPEQAIIAYGRSKAKVDITQVDNSLDDGSLILVTGVSPTPSGEGKSTVLIGLTDALRKLGKNAMVALREPSLGPVMGMKGGAAGGGYSQVVPMEDINLHFTGDIHAITAANNTLAAIIDNHIHRGNPLGIDPESVTWQRCLDVNDRSLRDVDTPLRKDSFTITAASEVMAILCLATSLDDLKTKLGDITVGYTFDGSPVTARDLNAHGALTALLRDALNPNLVQTLGGSPAFVHGGPFANIAHGCNSILATQTALKYADYVVTEAGFGSDLGAEKFFDIKARLGDLKVAGAVIVATIRAVKHNGIENLERHVENLRKFGVKPVVALNLFANDTDEERQSMRQWANDFGVAYAESDGWARGGEGVVEVAEAVINNLGDDSHALYETGPVTDSIKTIAREIYRAGAVEYSDQAKKDLEHIRKNGWDHLPVCISKTQYSFSDDPTLLGAPIDHTLHVRELRVRTGAGFIVALTGKVLTMPGLPAVPAAENIDVNTEGNIIGLF